MDLLILRQRLRAVARPDAHAINGQYQIRSLYFDTPGDKALLEKINGVNRREKFRVRYYNNTPSFIKLEKKSKLNGLCLKESALISARDAQKLVDGHYDWLLKQEIPLLQQLYVKITQQGLRPKTLVDYTREAFIYAPGNVRVTLDFNIRTGLRCTDLLNPACVTVPLQNAPIILEVKWDNFLPDIIRDAIQLENCHASAFSKYAACRIYG